MTIVTISKDLSGRLLLTSPYDPLRSVKIKTIKGHRWHSDKKHWSFPNTDGTLEKILEVFKSEEIHIDPALYKSARVDPALQGTVPDLRPLKEVIRGVESGLSPKYNVPKV